MVPIRMILMASWYRQFCLLIYPPSEKNFVRKIVVRRLDVTRTYAAIKCLLQKSHIRSSCVAYGTVLLKGHIFQVVFFNSKLKKGPLSYDHNAPNWW